MGLSSMNFRGHTIHFITVDVNLKKKKSESMKQYTAKLTIP